MSDVRRCGWCGARLGARDRICFSCRRPLSEPAPVATPAEPVTEPATEPVAVPAGPLRLELAWGRDRRTLSLPPAGATIGSTAEAVWWTLGLPAGGPLGHPFVTVFVTAWLGVLSGTALGLLISAAAESADRAMSLVPYLLITQLVLCGVLFQLGAIGFVSWLMPARWTVSGLGGIAGLSAAALHQTSGLYPHSAAGLAGTWLALLLLTGGGLAATVWRLRRQGLGWSVGRG